MGYLVSTRGFLLRFLVIGILIVLIMVIFMVLFFFFLITGRFSQFFRKEFQVDFCRQVGGFVLLRGLGYGLVVGKFIMYLLGFSFECIFMWMSSLQRALKGLQRRTQFVQKQVKFSFLRWSMWFFLMCRISFFCCSQVVQQFIQRYVCFLVIIRFVRFSFRFLRFGSGGIWDRGQGGGKFCW